MITLGGFTTIPKSTATASPEFFYYGDQVLGGVVNVEVAGVHHAETASEYSGMIDSALAMIDSCQSISVSAECGGTLSSIDGAQGVVKDVSVSAGGSPLDLSYSITLEVSKNAQKIPIIANQTDANVSAISSSAVARSYQATTSFEDAGSTTFAVGTNSHFYKTHGKFTTSISVGLYDSDRCDSSDVDYASGISAFLDSEVESLSSEFIKDDGFGLYGLLSKKSVGKMDGSATYEQYALPQEAGSSVLGLLDYNVTESTDQKTEFPTTTVKGSIQGIGGTSSFMESAPDNSAYSNAKAIYGMVSNEELEATAKLLKLSCDVSAAGGASPDGASPGGASPGGGDGGDSANVTAGSAVTTAGGTCLKIFSTRVSEFPATAKIDFEIVFKELEDCEILGYKIRTNYEERASVTGRAEHLAPNRPNNFYPLTYYSKSSSAPRYKITVTADLPSTCVSSPVGISGYVPTGSNGEEPAETSVLSAAVGARLALDKNLYGLLGSNIMKISKRTNEGRYSYSITEEYIKCQ